MAAGSASKLRAATFCRCPGCHLIQQQPWVPQKAIGEFYGENYLPYQDPKVWGRYGKFVARSLKAQDRRRVRLVRRYAAHLANHQNLQKDNAPQVLDVGCGYPSFLQELLRQQKTLSAVGLDFKASGWENLAQNPRLELLEGTLASFANDSGDHHSRGPFSVITMWHYLEHDYDPLQSLQKCYNLLEPGGALIIEVPDYNSWSRRIYGGSWAGYHTPRHTAAYTPVTLAKLVSTAGFQVEHQMRYGTMPAYTLWWLSQLERRRKPTTDFHYLFWSYVRGSAMFGILHYLERWFPLGLQTLIARK